MNKRILVAYATGSGSTAEVAEAIGSTLRSSTVAVDVRPAADITSLEPYSAVVAGSSIRAGRWLPDALEFVTFFAGELSLRPTAYFTTCLTLIEDTQANRHTVRAYLAPVLAATPDVTPVALGLFAGSLDPTRRLIMPVDAGPQGDYRDWEAISEWARSIRPALLEGSASPLAVQNLTEAELRWADLSDDQLAHANLERANLIGAELRGANLREATLRHAILNGASMQDADLSGADLSGADLNWANLSRSDLTNANLRRANLGWAVLRDAELSGATLRNARYNDQTEWPEGFAPEKAGCLFVNEPH